MGIYTYEFHKSLKIFTFITLRTIIRLFHQQKETIAAPSIYRLQYPFFKMIRRKVF